MRRLTTGGYNSQPHISPDGSRIVYRSVREDVSALWSISAAGGEALKLTENAAGWPRFSPDGKFIACTYQTPEGKLKLAVLDAESVRPTQFFDKPATANFNNGLRWTPDGKALTYRD